MIIKPPTFNIQHFFVLVMMLSVSDLFAQKQLTRELQVENDNDAYTLNWTRDQYYSQGVALRYRILTDSSKWKESTEKVIKAFVLNHRFYTAKHLFWADSADMDRPYAGQISLSTTREYYFKSNSYIYAELEVGWMGPALRMGDLQRNWHKTFGMQAPLGWRYQINNSPILNLYGKYAKVLWEAADVDVSSQSNLALGTAFSHARQEILFRIGNFKPLHQSTQFNGRLGQVNNGSKLHEAYFFISPGIEYVVYNSTIEGGLIGEESIFTKESEKWIYQTRAGFLLSWTKFDLALFYYRRTKETSESTFHKYVGIRLGLRF
ncbi:MAG: lipid A deacylase LpxR family protein [Cyclobacteriaceae bacterium]